jgi:hypothetical protein
MRASLIIATLALVQWACESVFDPHGPYEERPVVYGILSRATDAQYVRVYTTYNAPGAAQQSVDLAHEAVVTLFGDGTSWVLRDTTIERQDQTRSTTPIEAKVLSPFVPSGGAEYRLSVQLPSGLTVEATAVVPASGFLSVLNEYVLTQPTVFTDDISVFLQIAPTTRGFLVRFFIEIEIDATGGGRERKRVEVPQAIRYSSVTQQFEPHYPRLTRRTTPEGGRTPGREFFDFQNQAYRLMLRSVMEEHAHLNPVLRRAVFVLIQSDANLYTYFNIVNGFQDEYSIRTDLPDFSNIQGGVGVFGAMTADTLFIPYR